MLQLPKPTVVGQVSIDTPSAGTKVEIRAASTASPSTLNDATVLAPPFTLKPGHNVIPVKSAAPTSNLLVWISTLGTTNGKSQASIQEITVQAAS
jgi:putative peptidoglycan lipid II flippase